MPKVRKKRRTCVVCGGPLTIEDGRVCIGCALIALYGGNDPRIKEAQAEVWRRALEAAGYVPSLQR